MIDFLVFVIFAAAGTVFGAFFGYLLMRRLWSGKPVDKDFLGGLLAVLFAIFGATR